MKPIETRYAGCRFRSRLEARWAVFFDHMAIRWEYEPEGYMIGPYDDQRPYLPDFWLPDIRQWVEVKGSILDLYERLKIVHATIPHPGWGLPDNDKGVLLLGGIPEPRSDVVAWHHVFTFHKGDLYRSPFEWGDPTSLGAARGGGHIWQREWNIACGVDCGDYESPASAAVGLIGGRSWHNGVEVSSVWNPSASLMDSCIFGAGDPRVPRSYRAARSARFEHGESG